MKLLESKLGGMLAGLMLLHAATNSCLADEPAGVARISDASPVATVNHTYSEYTPQVVHEMPATGYYGHPNMDRGYTSFSYVNATSNGKHAAALHAQEMNWRARNAESSHRLGQKLRCTFSFLRPLTFWDVGATYSNIAVDPGYSDPRDSQYYAVQGYGVPMSVPLAPVVSGSYNYSWGVPATRLTPIGEHPGKSGKQ